MKNIFNTKTIIFFIFLFSLWGVCYASPLSLIYPENGATDVKVDEYFRWQKVPGAIKYLIDINEFTQSEDNVMPTVCTDSICSFSFLNLTVGNIEYLSTYNWRVVAFDAGQNPIDSSPIYQFSTEAEPEPPPNGNGGNGNGGGNGGGSPIDLINPLKAETLEEAINALLNFLFLLAIILAPLIIIIAAFMIMTAHGDAKQINKARTIITWTLIAFAIILLAKGIPTLIKGALST